LALLFWGQSDQPGDELLGTFEIKKGRREDSTLEGEPKSWRDLFLSKQ